MSDVAFIGIAFVVIHGARPTDGPCLDMYRLFRDNLPSLSSFTRGQRWEKGLLAWVLFCLGGPDQGTSFSFRPWGQVDFAISDAFTRTGTQHLAPTGALKYEMG